MSDEMKSIESALNNIESKMANSASKEELNKLGEEQVKLARQLADLSQKGIKLAGTPEIKSVGQQFVETEAYKSVVSGGNMKASVIINEIEAKSANDPMLTSNTAHGNVIQAYRRPGIMPGVFRPLTIESLLPSINIASNAFEYVKETKFENGADFHAEGAKIGKSSVEFETVSDTVKNIGHMARISKQLVADAPALLAYINLRMVYGVDLKVEDQIVNGVKGSNAFDGLFQTSSFTAHGCQLANLGGATAKPTIFDLILYTKTKMEANFLRPNVILMHPTDWSTLLMTKNASGDYYLGTPSSMASKTLWGIPVFTSPAIPVGKFMVCDTTQAGMIYARQGLELALYEQDEDNVQKGLVTIVARRRLGLGLEKKEALIGGDLAVPKS